MRVRSLFAPWDLNVSVARVTIVVALAGLRFSAAADAPVHATIDEAIARGDLDDVKRHLDRDPGLLRGSADAKLAPLHQAILRRQTKITSYLLERGASVESPDSAGRTPLHLAVER